MGENAITLVREHYEQKDVWKALLEMYNSL